jgi:two-component system sensor histidine kinase KdpD
MTLAPLRGYGIAVACVVVSAAITAVMWPWLSQSPSLLFMPAVMVSALYGGLGPGLLAAGGSVCVLSFFFLPPYLSFAVSGVSDLVRLAIFALTTLLVTSVAADRRRAEELSRALGALAEQRRREAERLYRDLEADFKRESEAEGTRRSEQLKAALLDALTHDLRTPLTAMKAAATALRCGEMRDNPDAQREMLDVIKEEVDRLDRFVGHLRHGDHDPPVAEVRGGTIQGLLRASSGRGLSDFVDDPRS